MSRKSAFFIAFLALVLMAPAAHAAAGAWVISGNGGMALPTGDFGDSNKLDASTGYQFGGAIDYMVNDMFAVGIDGSYNKNKHGAEGETIDLGGGVTAVYTSDKFTTWQVGARGKYMIPTGASQVSPYLLAGAGIYNTKEKWEGSYTVGGVTTPDNGEATSDSRFGFKFGAGASYKATEQVGIGVEGDYNFITEDKAKVNVSNLQYIGVHAFVSWALMTK